MLIRDKIDNGRMALFFVEQNLPKSRTLYEVYDQNGWKWFAGWNFDEAVAYWAKMVAQNVK